MKILVTGTAGFIGYHLTKALLENGHSVIGLDNINNYYDTSLKYARLQDLGIQENKIVYNISSPSTIYPKHSFIKLDLTDREAIEKLFEKGNFETVIHLAGQAGVRYSSENPHHYISSNIMGFLNILEGCRHHKVAKLLYASSSSVYGNTQTQPSKITDNTDHPLSLYAATKKSNELMAYTYAHLYHMHTIGLRFFTVYGPWGRPDMAPMLFTNAILNDVPIKVFNHGEMYRDFTYIDDVVTAMISIIDKPAVSQSIKAKIYNIGNNTPESLTDFIHTLENILQKIAQKDFMPKHHDEMISTHADISESIHDFGYQPTTSLQEGLHQFINWYKKYYRL